MPVRISTSPLRPDVGENTPLDGEGFVLPTLQTAIEDLRHRFDHLERVEGGTREHVEAFQRAARLLRQGLGEPCP